jgi:hypothetical protein
VELDAADAAGIDAALARAVEFGKLDPVAAAQAKVLTTEIRDRALSKGPSPYNAVGFVLDVGDRPGLAVRFSVRDMSKNLVLDKTQMSLVFAR